MIRLIGGSARCGKSTLSRSVVAATTGSQLVSLDNLLESLAVVADAKTRAALRTAPGVYTHTPQEWVSGLRVRDRVLWDAARAYLDRAGTEDVIVEGGLWPDFVAATSTGMVGSARVVFLVDTGDSAQRLLHIAHTVPGNWIARRGWPDKKIRRFADYNRYRSEQITAQASAFGYPVIDIADHGRMCGAHDAALTHLTGLDRRATGPDQSVAPSEHENA